MRVSSRLLGLALGLLVINGCSSPDSGPRADTAVADAGAAGSSGGDELSGNAKLSSDGASAHRFSIRFDYRFDTVGFFAMPERRAALEAAGAIWSKLIADDFEPVPKGTRIRASNPEQRDEYLWVNGIEDDIDDLLVFVGTSEAISGLGRGGPSGTAQTDDAALAAALNARRDGADFEPWAGSISFKASSNFFFDPTPETADDIPPGSYDFIALATHELGHVLGFAACAAFSDLSSGTSFIGPATEAIYGGPVPLTSDAAHFANHLQSDGIETLMDPGLTNGVRYGLTRLDRAVFVDLGYEISN